MITRSQKKEKDNFDRYIRECLDIPLKICPKSKDVCAFYFEGYCYESGEKKDLARVKCE